jgi:hypothetical protein
MRKPGVMLALAALVLSAGLGLGCGGSSEAAGQPRILKQEAVSLAGAVTTTWVYSYDAVGYVTEIKAYGASNVLTGTTVYTTEGGLRTLATIKDATGAVTSTQVFTYTNGVLSRLDFVSSGNALTGYNTYDFVAGRKLVTHRYGPTGTSLGENDFSYEAATGKRTTTIAKDAAGTTTMTATRTYAGDLWTQAQFDYPGGVTPSVIRRFTYETGPLAFDVNVFFEF